MIKKSLDVIILLIIWFLKYFLLSRFCLVFLPTTLASLPPGVMLLHHSTTPRDSATDIKKTYRKGAPEWERPNRSVVKRARFCTSLYVFETWGDVASFEYEWKVEGECIVTVIKKIISYLISSQLNQVCDMKIDTFWRITSRLFLFISIICLVV